MINHTDHPDDGYSYELCPACHPVIPNNPDTSRMTMCTCNAQLQPHDWIEGVCPDPTQEGMPDLKGSQWEPEAAAAAERDPEDVYRDLGGEG